MEVKVDFGSEIGTAIQRHLQGGCSVRRYIRAAVIHFNKLLSEEEAGAATGYGVAKRFKQYNTEYSAKGTLDSSLADD